jgi:uncharacterized protein (TIGR01244 family)
MDMRRLDECTFVAGQIWPEQLPELARNGVTMIVNNRPDFEEAGQPEAAEIEAAARAAGVEYRFVPIASGISEAEIEAMADAIEAAEGKLLAFCRSGTRSTMVWALARARLGEKEESLSRKAAAAGYDLAPIKGFLDRARRR